MTAARPAEPDREPPDRVAFLRGVNVGGHAPITSGELVRCFQRLGLRAVTAYRASGNVAFRSPPPGRPPGELEREIAQALSGSLGTAPGVFLRSASELAGIVGRDRFSAHLGPDDTPYVTFLPAAPGAPPRLPWRSRRGTVDLLSVEGREVFSVARRVGKVSGFPNAEVEKLFDLPATTRHLSTVEGVLRLLRDDGAPGRSEKRRPKVL